MQAVKVRVQFGERAHGNDALCDRSPGELQTLDVHFRGCQDNEGEDFKVNTWLLRVAAASCKRLQHLAISYDASLYDSSTSSHNGLSRVDPLAALACIPSEKLTKEKGGRYKQQSSA